MDLRKTMLKVGCIVAVMVAFRCDPTSEAYLIEESLIFMYMFWLMPPLNEKRNVKRAIKR